MCGIFFSCRKNTFDAPGSSLRGNLERRGPDHCNTARRKLEGSNKQPTKYLEFFSTVLSLRGDHVIGQPLVDSASSSVLCWNGEAWKIDGTVIDGNDAKIVFDLLLEPVLPCVIGPCTQRMLSQSACDKVNDVFSRIAGPYAFIYYDAPNAQVFYGRDALGRRSLLTNKNRKGSFLLSSVCNPADAHEWAEVEADGIYRLDLYAEEDASQTTITAQESSENSCLVLPQLPATSPSIVPQLVLPQSPRFPPLNEALPVAQSPVLTPSLFVVGKLAEFLEASLRLRVENIPVPPCDQVNPPPLAVLFSGGLDCTILARRVHEIVPKHQKIDLLNVSFENPRVIQAAAKRDREFESPHSPYELCPDRITGHASHQELMRTCPQRKWRFVCINVPYTETTEHRHKIITLIQPHNTEMDLSIACALYFAARGKGLVYDNATDSIGAYTTPARVLLSGLGADELFGGYQRHATAFHRGGHPALIKELELDFGRLGKRNLGRDDRVIAHWGKEVRYPYLDESLVTWALGLPVWEKCGFGTPVDPEKGPDHTLESGKKLLRLLALKDGLNGTAFEKKRAIQFGARTAKMELGKVKGTQPLA